MGEIGITMQAFWQPLHKVIHTVPLSGAQRKKQLCEDLRKELERESQNPSKAFTCAHLGSQMTVGLFFYCRRLQLSQLRSTKSSAALFPDWCAAALVKCVYRTITTYQFISHMCDWQVMFGPVAADGNQGATDVWEGTGKVLSFRKHCLTLLANRGNWLESFNVPKKYAAALYHGCLIQNPLWSRTITASSPSLPSARLSPPLSHPSHISSSASTSPPMFLPFSPSLCYFFTHLSFVAIASHSIPSSLSSSASWAAGTKPCMYQWDT